LWRTEAAVFHIKLVAQLFALALLWLLPWLALANACAWRPVDQLRATRTADGYWVDLFRDGQLKSTTRLTPSAKMRLELSALDVNHDGHLDIISSWIADGRVWTQVWLYHKGAFEPVAPPTANLLVSAVP
jgi:hypothetical protein